MCRDQIGWNTPALEKAHGIGEFKGTASDTVFCSKWDTRL